MQQVASDDNARCNETVAAQRLKPAQAAAKLGINRSSLKRYLDTYPELMPDGKTVDLEQVRKHRADNPSVIDAVRKVEERETSKPKPAALGGRTESKSRLEDAKAISAELDLAERLGQLVDPGEMLDAVAEAANFLRENFSGVDPNLCERLASETDPRQIRVVIEAHYRKILAEVKDKFDAIVKPKTDEGQ